MVMLSKIINIITVPWFIMVTVIGGDFWLMWNVFDGLPVFLGFNALNLNPATNQISTISLTELVISVPKYHGNNNNQSTEQITNQPDLLHYLLTRVMIVGSVISLRLNMCTTMIGNEVVDCGEQC